MAWDQDMGPGPVIFQYNYSHHNNGGAVLWMSSQGVFRYNISANEGGATWYMRDLANDSYKNSNTLAVPIIGGETSAMSYRNGRPLFKINQSTKGPQVPVVYNNVFFFGPDMPSDFGLYGFDTTTTNKWVRFYNNIILKIGTGTLHLSYGSNGSGYPDGYIVNPEGFTNNLIWAYDNDQNIGNMGRIKNGTGSTSVNEMFGSGNIYGNKWENPKLKIQDYPIVQDTKLATQNLQPPRDTNMAGWTAPQNDRGQIEIFRHQRNNIFSFGRFVQYPAHDFI
jgi:hypothetical protein